MKTNILIAVFLCSVFTIQIQAQAGITTNNPNKNAILDLNKTDGTNTKGLILPKVTLTGTNNASPLSAHTAGMKVYNTATNGSGATAVTPGQYFNDGSQWIRVPATAWELTGNSGTVPTANFIGTTDAVDFIEETNNTERMRITSNGQVLTGTATVPTGGTNSKLILNNGTTAGALQIKDGTEGAGKLFVSDANGLGKWQSLSLGYRLMSMDVSQTGGPIDLTVVNLGMPYSNFQFISPSTVTVTVPSGYSTVKVVVRWDIWGGVYATAYNQGSLRFTVRQTGTASTDIWSVAMTSWASASSTLGTIFNVPATYTVSNLAPGTYSFQIGIGREDETDVPSSIKLWGIKGRAEVYVQ